MHQSGNPGRQKIWHSSSNTSRLDIILNNRIKKLKYKTIKHKRLITVIVDIYIHNTFIHNIATKIVICQEIHSMYYPHHHQQ